MTSKTVCTISHHGTKSIFLSSFFHSYRVEIYHTCFNLQRSIYIWHAFIYFKYIHHYSSKCLMVSRSRLQCIDEGYRGVLVGTPACIACLKPRHIRFSSTYWRGILKKKVSPTRILSKKVVSSFSLYSVIFKKLTYKYLYHIILPYSIYPYYVKVRFPIRSLFMSSAGHHVLRIFSHSLGTWDVSYSVDN